MSICFIASKENLLLVKLKMKSLMLFSFNCGKLKDRIKELNGIEYEIVR